MQYTSTIPLNPPPLSAPNLFLSSKKPSYIYKPFIPVARKPSLPNISLLDQNHKKAYNVICYKFASKSASHMGL